MVTLMDECCPIEFDTAPPALAAGAVHLWRVRLDVGLSHQHQMTQFLSLEERDRAERLQILSKRQQFIVGRSQLRRILSRYIPCEPQQIRFDYTARGKPILASGCGDRPCWFNLAHSGHLALIAIAAHGRVGIDIEAIRPIRLDALAKRFLQPAEVEGLFTLPAEQRQRAFFRLWTCKEAYLKATGEGLMGLHRISVIWREDVPLLQPQSAQTHWSLHELAIEDGFAAALAVEGDCSSMQWFTP